MVINEETINSMSNFISRNWCKFLNLLHKPMVSHGANDPYHEIFKHFCMEANSNVQALILELGSRDVTGVRRNRLFPNCKKYIGFDIIPGDCVDVVGDAHLLSSYFEKGTIDFVYAVSVFEHLMFPWKVVTEANRVMKKGGLIYISTHPAWPNHEMPWDFWRFQQNAFQGLFNSFTGFEIVKVSEGLPAKLYSLVDDSPTKGLYNSGMNMGVAVIARKIGDYDEKLLRWDITPGLVVDTNYPARKTA
ncbi:MAG: hypothetical protein RIR17_2124 [Planctomycetota bacterium]